MSRLTSCSVLEYFGTNLWQGRILLAGWVAAPVVLPWHEHDEEITLEFPCTYRYLKGPARPKGV
jgi:hypothetical protein